MGRRPAERRAHVGVLIGAVTALVLLLGAAPPVVAAPAASVSAPPRPADAGALERAAAQVAALPPAVAPAEKASSDGAAVRPLARLVGQRWYDACSETSGQPLDVRETAVAPVPGGSAPGELLFQVRGCGPVTPETLGPDGAVLWALTTPALRAPARTFTVELAAPAGRLAARLLRDDDGEGPGLPVDVRALDTGTVPTDPTVAAVYVPTASLGLRDGAFDLLLRSVGPAGTVPDAVPEPDEQGVRGTGVLAYPHSCDVSASRVAAVTQPGAAPAVAARLRAEGVDATAARRLPTVVVDLDDPGDASALRRTAGVVDVRPVLPVHRAEVPTDPLLPYSTWLDEIGARAGWDVRSDPGDRVLAVVDDGVDGSRPDLAGQVLEGRDLRRVGAPVIPTGADSDRGGHGTAVAGVAAAAADGEGMVGVAQGALLRPYRVFDAGGCGEDVAVADAVILAVDAGASVVNLSLGAPARSEVLEGAVVDATARGALVVASSGNSGADDHGLDGVAWPAASPGAVAVGAVDADGRRAPFSAGGPDLDLVAPGVDVLTLGDISGFAYVSGTSFSAPAVSGAALLYRAEHPDASPEIVGRALRLSALDLGPPGRDDETGRGLLRLPELLAWTPPAASSTDVACPAGQVPSSPFADVADADVHGAAVACSAWWGVAQGRSGGLFAPEEPVRRDQMATFLARLLSDVGVALPAGAPDAFADDDGSVHEPAIDALAALGVVSGRPGVGFAPEETVTRGQIATFLARAAERARVTPGPGDVPAFEDLDGSVHAAAITSAARLGLATGAVDGTYRPRGAVRRDQMASFLARTLDLLSEAREVAPPGVS